MTFVCKLIKWLIKIMDFKIRSVFNLSKCFTCSYSISTGGIFCDFRCCWLSFVFLYKQKLTTTWLGHAIWHFFDARLLLSLLIFFRKFLCIIFFYQLFSHKQGGDIVEYFSCAFLDRKRVWWQYFDLFIGATRKRNNQKSTGKKSKYKIATKSLGYQLG